MAVTIDGTNGITTPDLESTGPIIGTTGTFSGAVQVSGIATTLYPIVSGTVVATTSGSFFDFTGIPSWVKRITVMFNGVSGLSTTFLEVSVGAGSIATSGYISTCLSITSTASAASSTSSLIMGSITAGGSASGTMVLTNISGNNWVSTSLVKVSASTLGFGAGSVALGGVLDRIRISFDDGSDFDAGSINILYE